MLKRSRQNNNSNSNTSSTATSKRTKTFGSPFYEKMSKLFNINNVNKQMGYKNPKPKRTRKQSTPKKSPNK
tara:strand:+ start:60 stop:272 length:213 start_codon:yes stop_codon:yes gene_type:complete